MKSVIASMLFLTIASISFAQNPLPVEISYDAAGNRVSRKVLQVNMSKKGGSCPDTSFYSDMIQSIPVRVYPNPTQGIVYVDLPNTGKDFPNRVRLFDSHGKLIFEKEGSGNKMEIDISSYPAGYYIVELSAKDEHTTWKIIKQ